MNVPAQASQPSNRFIAINTAHDLVLCVECDSYIECANGDTWLGYFNKSVKHLNKHRSNNGLKVLSESERLEICAFFKFYVQGDLSLNQPNIDINSLFGRDAFENPQPALFKVNKTNICDGYLCNIQTCAYIVVNAKNRLQKFKAHCKKLHNGCAPDFCNVKVQEFRYNTFILLGRADIDVKFESEEVMIFLDPTKLADVAEPAEPQNSEDDENRGNLLESLYLASDANAPYFVKWEKFLRIEIGFNIVQSLFNKDGKGEIKVWVDKWFEDKTKLWEARIEDNYALQERVMRYQKSGAFKKRLQLRPIKSKGLQLLFEILTFSFNFLNLSEQGLIPKIWTDLLSESSLVLLSALSKEDDPQKVTQLLDSYLQGLFSAEVELCREQLSILFPSAFLISWIFGNGNSDIIVRLRNVSSKAYAFENLVRFQSCLSYVEKGDDSVLQKIELEVERDNKSWSTVTAQIHHIFKRTKPFSVSPQLKIEPLNSDDTSLHRLRNGSLWSVDRQRLALKQALADFDELCHDLGHGFIFYNESYGIFSANGEIICRDEIFTDTPGFGLSVSVNQLSRLNPLASDGKSVQEFLGLKKDGNMLKVRGGILKVSLR
jgi:hypothetical protein